MDIAKWSVNCRIWHARGPEGSQSWAVLYHVKKKIVFFSKDLPTDTIKTWQMSWVANLGQSICMGTIQLTSYPEGVGQSVVLPGEKRCTSKNRHREAKWLAYINGRVMAGTEVFKSNSRVTRSQKKFEWAQNFKRELSWNWWNISFWNLKSPMVCVNLELVRKQWTVFRKPLWICMTKFGLGKHLSQTYTEIFCLYLTPNQDEFCLVSALIS